MTFKKLIIKIPCLKVLIMFYFIFIFLLKNHFYKNQNKYIAYSDISPFIPYLEFTLHTIHAASTPSFQPQMQQSIHHNIFTSAIKFYD